MRFDTTSANTKLVLKVKIFQFLSRLLCGGVRFDREGQQECYMEPSARKLIQVPRKSSEDLHHWSKNIQRSREHKALENLNHDIFTRMPTIDAMFHSPLCCYETLWHHIGTTTISVQVLFARLTGKVLFSLLRSVAWLRCWPWSGHALVYCKTYTSNQCHFTFLYQNGSLSLHLNASRSDQNTWALHTQMWKMYVLQWRKKSGIFPDRISYGLTHRCLQSEHQSILTNNSLLLTSGSQVYTTGQAHGTFSFLMTLTK